MPKTHERELKLKFAMGLTDYRELMQQIMGYSQQIRLEGAYSRGDNDMDVGSLEAWESFLAQAYRKDKGKGKGKRGKGFGGSASDSGKGNQSGGSQGGGLSGPRPFAPPGPARRTCAFVTGV